MQSQILAALWPVEQEVPQRLDTVFVLTPALAYLILPGSGFLAAALARLYPFSHAQSSESQRCHTLAAVVDRLPSFSASSAKEPNREITADKGAEGMSMLTLSDPAGLSPRLFQEMPSEENEGRGRKYEPGFLSIRFPYPSGGHSFSHKTLEVPLANTIFDTGREYTMLASTWSPSPDLHVWEQRSYVEKSQMQIELAGLWPDSLSTPSLEIPLIPLTTPRRILDGFGNILRRLEVEEGTALPASEELEGSLDEFLRVRNLEPRPASVWALVLPHDKVAEDPKLRLVNCGHGSDTILRPVTSIQEDWTNESILPPAYLSDLLLSGGARLHRVLSGGGGWGQKRGLLSLDPESCFSKPASSRLSDILGGSGADGMDEASSRLGEVARTGDYVQSSQPRHWMSPDHSRLSRRSIHLPRQKTLPL